MVCVLVVCLCVAPYVDGGGRWRGPLGKSHVAFGGRVCPGCRPGQWSVDRGALRRRGCGIGQGRSAGNRVDPAARGKEKDIERGSARPFAGTQPMSEKQLRSS